MISIRNKSEEIVQLQVPGSQTAANDLSVAMAPFAGIIRAIYAKVGTAGVTGTQSTDVKKNGVSIFSGATRLDFASGTQACTYGARTTNPPVVAKGDIITLDNIGVHSGTPAKNLSVWVCFRRGRVSPVPAMETDTVSTQSDGV